MGEADRKIDAAARAVREALAAVGDMPGSMDKAEAARKLAAEMREASDSANAVFRAEVIRVYETEDISYAKLGKRFGLTKSRVQQIVTSGIADEDAAAEPANLPEPRPVVAAVVTSSLGVLVGKRNDNSPPWTFIAGEIEAGESPAQAAEREVMEETGLRVIAAKVIGRRVHPRSGRLMVYISATPADGTNVSVGDPDELAEVRWVSLAEADELMSGAIYEPVKAHLRRTLLP